MNPTHDLVGDINRIAHGMLVSGMPCMLLGHVSNELDVVWHGAMEKS
ncbi:hypothetical protein D2E26_0332 [Bifidobacterium dolichotidis]|uniref:Uncharacterized protein n=1 Tax=Bifidobacterium dolichotidis TaxID=2306976 RepID=A0A430FSD8_9BIFI|nr:hypothetical protein D2E26_0332 [Bifidobacterium dolichotidis]